MDETITAAEIMAAIETLRSVPRQEYYPIEVPCYVFDNLAHIPWYMRLLW